MTPGEYDRRLGEVNHPAIAGQTATAQKVKRNIRTAIYSLNIHT